MPILLKAAQAFLLFGVVIWVLAVFNFVRLIIDDAVETFHKRDEGLILDFLYFSGQVWIAVALGILLIWGPTLFASYLLDLAP